jgi:hypothetical protein
LGQHRTGLEAGGRVQKEISLLTVKRPTLNLFCADPMTSPSIKSSRPKYLLVLEEFVDADSVDAFRIGANVFLDLAALAGKSGRAVAAEVVDQVGAVGAQQTGLLGAVVDIDVAQDALPTGGTVTDEATLEFK